ncbi:MAG: heparinase II/III family protein [Clostridia bacterium]|nr:heparinase II/III family protein [Clostridia bacterium]
MKSGIRVFRKNGITAKGNLLPLSEFRPFREFDEWKIDEEKAPAIIKRAEEFLAKELTPIPLSLFRDKFLTGSRSRYEAVHHERRSMVLYMTLAEMYEKKGRFIEKIVDVIWAIMEESSWVIPAHIGNSLTDPTTTVPEIIDERAMPGLDLYSANCCATLATAKYFLGDKFDEISPIIGKKIDHLIYLRGFRPFLSGNYWWMSSSCNWVTNVTNSILTAAAYTVEDMRFREQLVDRAMSLLDGFTANYPEDGCCDEGPGYWGGAAGSLFDSLELLDDMSGGKIGVWHEPIIRNMCEFITTMNVDGQYYVNFEDCHPKFTPNGDRIMRMGEKLDSAPLRDFGRAIAINRTAPFHYFAFNYCTVKDAISPVVKEAPRVTANLGTWLAGHKIAVFREFDDTSRGFFLATKGGTNSEPGNHNDVGCLVIAKNGNPLVVDPGIGSYNNNYFSRKERYMRWFTNASYHSCPTVDGIDQDTGNYYSQNEDVNIEERRASMDIGTAYPKEAGIVSLVRTSHLTEGKVTVTDDVKLDREGEIAFHFTLHYEPKVDAEGVIDIGEGVKLSYDKALALDVEKIENKCLPYDDLNFQSNWGVDNLWRANFTVRAKEFKAIFEFV